LIGVTLAAAPPDAEHQYGHKKFEVLSSMMISLFIFAGAFEVLRESWQRVTREGPVAVPHVTWVSFVVISVSLVLGFVLSRYESRRAEALQSRILESDAAHTWGDVAGSLAVLVGLALTYFLNPAADAFVAFALGLYLVRVGYKVLMRNLGDVTDRAVLDPAAVERVAREFEGVFGTAR